MSNNSNKALLNYWNKVRAGRQAPTRVEISPADISKILPDTFILEVGNQQHLKYRLAGSRICDYFGREFRGVNFYDGWPITEQQILQKYLSKVINQGAVLSVQCKASSEREHSGKFNIIFLPLTHSGTEIDRILGAISPETEWAWLGAAPLNLDEVLEVNITLERGTSLNLSDSHELKDEIMPFIPHKRLVKGKNTQFRVYEGGKL